MSEFLKRRLADLEIEFMLELVRDSGCGGGRE